MQETLSIIAINFSLFIFLLKKLFDLHKIFNEEISELRKELLKKIDENKQEILELRLYIERL